MKIVICAQDYPEHIGGPHVWMARIIPEFRKRGVECVVLFTIGGEGSEFKYIHLLQKLGVRYYIYRGAQYTEQKVRWILKMVKKEKPDIFIPDYDIPAHFATQWIHEAGIPTISVLRSDDHLYRSIIQEFISKPGPRTPTAVVCVSDYLENLVKSTNSSLLVKRIPSGTPIPDKMAKWNDQTLRLIYTGRIVEEQKRISELTLALCKVVRAIPGTEAFIYGSGKPRTVNRVLEIIKTSGEGLPIYYGGRIESDEIQSKLLDAHVFVLLSDYEGLPTSVIEAMACGVVPVCMYMQSGIPELVENGISGILVRDRDTEFLRAIKSLKYEKALWEKLSSNARKKVEADYSIERSVEKWVDLLATVRGRMAIEGANIRIPRRIVLPEFDPKFDRWDTRWSGYFYHLKTLWRESRKNVKMRFKKLRIVRSLKNNASRKMIGMTSMHERHYFRYCARSIYTGQGEIVDLGCWLGSTTVALARGLKENERVKKKKNRIHAYDKFIWYAAMDENVQHTELEGKYKEGDSFLKEYDRRTRNYAKYISVHVGDLCEITWNGKGIEILLIDAMKSWDLCNSIIRTFYPPLIPGKSYVLHQDFAHYYTPWIHLTHYRLKDYFEFVQEIERGSTVVFKYTAQIPDHVLQRTYSIGDFSEEEINEAFDYSMSLVGLSKRWNIIAAKIMLYVHSNDYGKAKTEYERYIQDGIPSCSELERVNAILAGHRIQENHMKLKD